MSDITDVIRGDTLGIAVSVTPVQDITNWVAFLTVNVQSNPVDDTAAILALTQTIPNGYTFTDAYGTIYTAANGQYVFVVPNSTTQGLAPGDYNYDVQVKDLNGNISSTKSGTFSIIADITRRIS